MARQNYDARKEAINACRGIEWTEHQTTRTIGNMTENVKFETVVSEDGRWIRVAQREYTPMFGYLAWPISSQRMDQEARKINAGARIVDDILLPGPTVRARWVRTYRVQD